MAALQHRKLGRERRLFGAEAAVLLVVRRMDRQMAQLTAA
jgi:hypothetical protein